jgi:hypothetical protein
MGQVTRSEWRWTAAFAAVVAVLLTLPYLLAYQSQGADWRFSGFLFGVEDGNSYIADMRMGAEGAWLFRIPYTTEPQKGALIYLPYLLLGKLAGGAAMHEQLVALFHLARIAAGFAMLLAVYRFLACFIEDVKLRRWGLLAAAFGGGFGWILLAKGAFPLELTSPEAFGFLSLFGLPHLAAARALLLLAFVWLVEPAPAAESKRRGVQAGLALAGAWLFQPITVAVAWAVMAAWLAALFLRGRVRRAPNSDSLRAGIVRALSAAAVTIPPMLYSALSFALDPVLRQWSAQNTLPSPPLWEYALSYGVLLLPALAGAWIALREDDRWLLPAGWMAVFPLLVSLPVTIQRRLAEGFWMALIVLALLFVERKLAGRARRAAFVPGMTLLLPAAALFVGWAMLRSAIPSEPAFLPIGQVRALEWLDSTVDREAIVLSDFDAGNAVPAYTGLFAFIGHGPETLNNPEKLILVEKIFDGAQTDAERLAILRRTGAEYVLVGPAERERVGAGIPGCILIYSRGGWDIWMVVPATV